MNPLVSIVIPTYQRRESLKITLESVLSQSYQNYEILIIDDGSKDGTREMIYNLKDQRIIYIWQNNTGGPANPRNKGILSARGEWIAFLDSDDIWTSDKLEQCVDNFNDKVDLIYHKLEIISGRQKLIKRNIYSRQLKKPVLIDLLLSGNVIANSSVVVRKKILQKVGLISESKKLIASEDYNTWLKISSVTEKFLYLSKRLGYYYQSDKSISSKDMSQSYKFATHQFLPFLNKEQKIKLETNIRYSSGRFNYLNNFYKKAKKDLLFVLKFGSINLKFKSMIMIILMIKIFK